MPQLAFLSTAHIHTKSFLETVRDHDDAAACVIWDDTPDRGQGYAQQFDVPFVEDLEAALKDPKVDGFVICSETTRHLPLLEQALPLGKPVMCEKPLATSAADAKAIAKLVQRHQTPLISGYFQPFIPANRGVKQLIESGALGQVTHAHFRNAHHAAYGRWFDKPELAWFADPELAGGGALMDMGTHAVHLLRHLMGPVEQVWAMTANVSGHYEKVDDFGMIQMRFSSGAIGRVEAGWCFTGGVGGLEVIGSERAVWSTGAGLVAGGPGADPQPVDAAEPRPDRIRRLIAVIRGEVDAGELADDLAACLDAVTIMDAAYRAAASGKWEAVQAL